MTHNNKKIIYWTTACLEPEIEAISKEVFDLAGHFRPVLIFSINPNIGFRFSLRKRYIGFNSRFFYPLLRLLVPMLETLGNINHVYGNIAPWIYHKGLKKKPVIHTIASEKGERNFEFLTKCRIIVVQTQNLMGELIRYGIDEKKIFCVYPGIDLANFSYEKQYPPLKNPKILFATAPREEKELKERGVYMLLEAARLDSSINYTLLFRKWAGSYTSIEKVRSLIQKYDLKNVVLRNEIVQDMAKEYKAHHFTVIPFTHKDGGKECPNSALESIATGRPVLVSDVSPFASFVRDHHCGSVYNNSPEGLVKTINSYMSLYHEKNLKLEGLAQSLFDRINTFSAYSCFYNTIK